MEAYNTYNTDLRRLALPEYGRHIQRMVEHLREIPDRNKRNEQAHAVIAVMGNLFPHLRDINDFKHKLWDHLFIIVGFDLDIDSPYPRPTPDTFENAPRPLPYKSSDSIRFKHYGRAVQEMAESVARLPEGESRNQAAISLATHMKRSYLLWNKDSVSDDVIFNDLARLSGGKIRISCDDVQLHVPNPNSEAAASSGSGSSSNNGRKKRPTKPSGKMRSGGKMKSPMKSSMKRPMKRPPRYNS